ncbi:Type I restriction enzyme EcoKI M protein, partial [Haemophilus influenzae]
MQARRDETRRD